MERPRGVEWALDRFKRAAKTTRELLFPTGNFPDADGYENDTLEDLERKFQNKLKKIHGEEYPEFKNQFDTFTHGVFKLTKLRRREEGVNGNIISFVRDVVIITAGTKEEVRSLVVDLIEIPYPSNHNKAPKASGFRLVITDGKIEYFVVNQFEPGSQSGVAVGIVNDVNLKKLYLDDASEILEKTKAPKMILPSFFIREDLQAA